MPERFAAAPGWTVATTPLGPVALAWTRRGVDRVVLPTAPGEEPPVLPPALPSLLPPGRAAVSPGRRPPAVRDLVARLRRHLAGRPDPLADVPLDLAACPPFHRRLYRSLRRVPPGATVTYGELARRAGRPGAARAVGRAMAANPVPLLVPCHRVLPAAGGVGAFSAAGGPDQKAWLLFREGVVPDDRLRAAYAHLRRVDRRLGRIIDRVGPYLPAFGPREDPYGLLVLSIVHQQLSMKAAATIAGRVRSLTPGPDFPDPDTLLALPDDRLRACGLSRQKIAYLRDLARHVRDGDVDLRALWRLPDAAVIATLTRIRGIGVWTVQMLLIFHLFRLDVWPAADLGLQKAVQRHLRLPAAPGPREMTALGERWAPYRSVAAWYLWRTVDGGGV